MPRQGERRAQERAHRTWPHDDDAERHVGSTQSSVRATALRQVAYPRSRSPGSIAGCHSRSTAQFARSSSGPRQKPTARPAA